MTLAVLRGGGALGLPLNAAYQRSLQDAFGPPFPATIEESSTPTKTPAREAGVLNEMTIFYYVVRLIEVAVTECTDDRYNE